MLKFLSVFFLFVTLQCASFSAFAQVQDLAEWQDELRNNGAAPEDFDAERDWYGTTKLGVTNFGRPILPLFDPADGHEYGALSGYGKSLGLNNTTNLTADVLDIVNETLQDGDSQLSRLGCANLDYEASMRAALEVRDTDMGEYFNSSLSNYMVTTLFNSPSVADLFQGLQDFGSKRVQAMQDRCAAIESKESESVMALRAEALNRCVSQIAGPGPYTRGDVDDAYRQCLLGGASTSMAAHAVNAASVDKWSGTFFDGLKNTSFCAARTDGGARTEADCALMSFLHNVRWCTGTVNDGVGCEGISSIKLTQPTVAQSMIFEATLMGTRAYLDHGYYTAEALSEGISSWSGGDETGREAALKYSLAIYDRDYGQQNVDSASEGNVEAVTPRPSSDPSADSALEKEYKQYVGCSESVGAATWPTRTYISNIQGDITSNFLALNEAATDEITRLNAMDLSMSPKLLMGRIFPASAGGSLSAEDLYTIDGARDFIAIALACTMVHDMPVTLRDYLNMTEAKDATPIRLGISQHIAQQVTENILSFIYHKLNLARLEMAYLPSTDPNAPAPHMKEAVGVAMEEVQSKLDAMRDYKNNRSTFAKAMSYIKTN